MMKMLIMILSTLKLEIFCVFGSYSSQRLLISEWSKTTKRSTTMNSSSSSPQPVGCELVQLMWKVFCLTDTVFLFAPLNFSGQNGFKRVHNAYTYWTADWLKPCNARVPRSRPSFQGGKPTMDGRLALLLLSQHFWTRHIHWAIHNIVV